MRKNRGFTLAELMIVVGIIAVLAAIAAPGLRAARKKVMLNRILADLRTINDARFQYCSAIGDSGCYDIPHEYLVPNYLKKVPVAPNGCMEYEYDHGNAEGTQGETRYGGWSADFLSTPAGEAAFRASCY